MRIKGWNYIKKFDKCFKISEIKLFKSLKTSISGLFSKLLSDMVFKDKDHNLIRISELVCGYIGELPYYCERFSNNKQPVFTDQGGYDDIPLRNPISGIHKNKTHPQICMWLFVGLVP